MGVLASVSILTQLGVLWYHRVNQEIMPSNTEEVPQAVGTEPTPPLFAEVSTPTPSVCSYNECLAGHRWPPAVVVAACPGCGSPILAVQKAQCPYCNEPCVRTMLRSDFVPRGSGAAKRCQGQPVNGESLDLELTRHQWQEVQAQPDTLFEERRATERGNEHGDGSKKD